MSKTCYCCRRPFTNLIEVSDTTRNENGRLLNKTKWKLCGNCNNNLLNLLMKNTLCTSMKEWVKMQR